MKHLAVIPARGGSTRLKDKNIYPLLEKPLINWSVENVINSNKFDKIYVSTDSEKIWDCVKNLPVHRHVRPEAHATVKATVLKAMVSFLKELEEKGEVYDTFSYFLPTCPLIQTTSIQEGIDKLEVDNVDSVICMTEYSETVQLACIINNERVIPIFDNLTSGLTNSKFIKKYYRPTGAFYMSKWNSLKNEESFFKGEIGSVVISKDRAVDINDIHDIRMAENAKLRLNDKDKN